MDQRRWREDRDHGCNVLILKSGPKKMEWRKRSQLQYSHPEEWTKEDGGEKEITVAMYFPDGRIQLKGSNILCMVNKNAP